MKTILDTIIDQKRSEVDQLKQKYSIADFENSEFYNEPTISLKQGLTSMDFGIIAEIKRKSPSAGSIHTNVNILSQGEAYSKAGVSGISCLTDYTFFGGTSEDLSLLKRKTNSPILRKDFIIDEYQIFESKAIGADAILLISEVLTPEEALHFTIMAQSLGMEVLMEAHDKKHLNKINDSVDIVGINNRDLHLQKTDLITSRILFDFIPCDAVCISESGISSRDELIELSHIGYNGALIGESILKQQNPSEFINSLFPEKSLAC